MKKSNLKYFFLAILLGTIYSLYHYNKQYFESPSSTFKKNTLTLGHSNSSNYSSGGSDNYTLNIQGTTTNSIGVEIEDTNLDESFKSNNSNSTSGFSSHENPFSSVSQNTSNISNDYDEGDYVSTINSNINQSSGGSGANSGMGSSAIAMNIPVTPDKRKEEEKKSKSESTTQVAAKRSFFDAASSGGSIDLPMSPGCPDCEVPLDGGASILFIIGTLLGVKKLFLKKPIVI